MKFLDQAKIFVRSGDGGNGCLSFRREKFIEFGGPNGGNGGRGADIIFQSVNNLNTLIDFRYQQHFKGARGGHGMGSSRSGASSTPLVIKVPVGTQIWSDGWENILGDFTEEGQQLTLLRGGDGGFGNEHYKSSTNRAPRRADPGWPGEELWVWLRLKLIADAGLVGLPNAGKSTFLSSVSRARPKIADYPFTTLVPQLGVVYIDDNEFVLADLPGLIEGAHQGIGLGHRFLGHLERCGVILHLIDGTSDDIEAAYHTIRTELANYGNETHKKPELIGLNKCDSLLETEIEEKTERLRRIAGETPIFPLSGISKNGVRPILQHLWQYITKFRQAQAPQTTPPEADPTRYGDWEKGGRCIDF